MLSTTILNVKDKVFQRGVNLNIRTYESKTQITIRNLLVFEKTFAFFEI